MTAHTQTVPLTDRIRQFSDDDIQAAAALLRRLDYDTQATVELIQVTVQGRELFGLPMSTDSTGGTP